MPSETPGATLVPPLTLQVTDPKLQQRIAQGLYHVSTTNLRLSATQPIGEIDFSYSDPETGARVDKRLTFSNEGYLVDLRVQSKGITGPSILSLGTNFGIHRWRTASSDL